MTHSYFGNDVGCQNWNNYWINEGINTFVERKIYQIYNNNDINYAKYEYYQGNVRFYETMLDYGIDNPYTALYPDIGVNNPEDTYSPVPFEKGAQFMYYIETLIGADMMQLMLNQYLESFHGMRINHYQFQIFYENFIYINFNNTTTTIASDDSTGGSTTINSTLAIDIINQTDFNRWMYQPGPPPVRSDFSNNLLPPQKSSSTSLFFPSTYKIQLTIMITSPLILLLGT